MKKVLIVMLSLYNGGAEKSLVNMLNELPADKYEVDILLFRKEGMFLDQVPTWVNVLETPRHLRLLYSPVMKCQEMFPAKVFGTLLSAILERQPNKRKGYRWEHFYSPKIESLKSEYDVAIAYITGEPMFYVGDKVNARKKIVWIHNDFRSEKDSIEYHYKYFKDMEIATISDECARIVEEEFPELNKKVHTIANITSSKITRQRADEFIPKEFIKQGANILSIGRLCDQKGFDLGIIAAAKLKERGIKLKWFVIGDGSLKSKLEKQISELKVEDYFVLLGARENPYPYIKNCDLFVQCSRYEGKSVVLDEAKILGTPIVVTDYPTVKDQIENKKEGYIVSIDPESIADGIEVMVKSEEERRRYTDYLLSHDYGNQNEIEKYMQLIDN
ncbi:glycosyltransferase [Butyrivibrio sp. WCD3002]|uniref:glycosyltransferase n=1 Tax=Butyrivibrio sp. WCD3002 TaxID=1280676 RepID=UPI00040CCB05|nr:glycosyltransferase [Butyrivibrio sp. WCD3002]